MMCLLLIAELGSQAISEVKKYLSSGTFHCYDNSDRLVVNYLLFIVTGSEHWSVQ